MQARTQEHYPCIEHTMSGTLPINQHSYLSINQHDFHCMREHIERIVQISRNILNTIENPEMKIHYEVILNTHYGLLANIQPYSEPIFSPVVSQEFYQNCNIQSGTHTYGAPCQLISDASNAQHKQHKHTKTKLCQSFSTSGQCKYGDKCVFAHGISELKTYKTKICRNWMNGRCTKTDCPFAHGTVEIHNFGACKDT
jgi:hypothetical protein